MKESRGRETDWQFHVNDFEFDGKAQAQSSVPLTAPGRKQKPPSGAPDVNKIYQEKLAAQKRFEDNIEAAINEMPNFAANLRTWLGSEQALELKRRDQLDGVSQRPGIAMKVAQRDVLDKKTIIEFINVSRNVFLTITLIRNRVESELNSCVLQSYGTEKLGVLLNQLAEIEPCKAVANLIRGKMNQPPPC